MHAVTGASEQPRGDAPGGEPGPFRELQSDWSQPLDATDQAAGCFA
jgi:hypothetical protein